MAANIETMMYAGETPWHGLGVKVEKEVTSADAIEAAGLDWTVSKRDVLTVDSAGNFIKIPGQKSIVRDSDDRVLSIMGEGYAPMQNKDAFEFFDSVVGSKEAIYHTAGALGNGSRVWMLAKLPGHIRVEGTDDVTEKFLLLANSHDGSLAITMKLTPIRVVCQNTLGAALRADGDFIKVRHTKNAAFKVEEARRTLKLASERFNEFDAMVQKMAKAKWNEASMKALAETLFPADKNGDVSARAVTSRDMLVDLFDNGKGQNMVRGSAWAAYNAVTEFTDWHRGTRVTDEGGSSQEARLNSVWFGSGAAMKTKALAYVMNAI